MITTEQKITSFGKLPAGWNYGQGSPATSDRVITAILYNRLYRAYGFSKTDAFPGNDGEIMITAYEGDHYVEITFEIDNTCRFVYEYQRNEEVYKEGLSRAEAVRFLIGAVEKVRLKTWPLCESSIQPITTTRHAMNLRISPFGLNEVWTGTSECLASTESVPSSKVGVSALTLRSTTNYSPPIPPYTGYSTRQNCLQEAA